MENFSKFLRELSDVTGKAKALTEGQTKYWSETLVKLKTLKSRGQDFSETKVDGDLKLLILQWKKVAKQYSDCVYDVSHLKLCLWRSQLSIFQANAAGRLITN
jgi:hypothetical protein